MLSILDGAMAVDIGVTTTEYMDAKSLAYCQTIPGGF